MSPDLFPVWDWLRAISLGFPPTLLSTKNSPHAPWGQEGVFWACHGVIFWGCHFLRGRVPLTPRGGSLLPPQPLKPWNLGPGGPSPPRLIPADFTLLFLAFCLLLLLRRRFSGFMVSSVQSLSRVQLCDPMDCSTPGLPVHHQRLEFTQTHVHRVCDAVQLSHPLSSPSPPAFNLSQHQSLFQRVSSGCCFFPEGLIWIQSTSS